MSKVLIIGAGGVGNVVTRKCAQIPDVFSKIVLASRTLKKCEQIKKQLDRPIKTEKVDANSVVVPLRMKSLYRANVHGRISPTWGEVKVYASWTFPIFSEHEWE